MTKKANFVHIQVGNCGNKIGTEFFEKIAKEHGLGPDGSLSGNQVEKASAYFDTGSYNGKWWYAPRAVVVDLDPATADYVKNSEYGKTFRPDNIITGAKGTGNNYAKGHMTEGAEIATIIMDVVRKEKERCDVDPGITTSYSLGGGTGSGLGSLLQLKIGDDYGHLKNYCFAVVPSEKVSDVVVEPYNAGLALDCIKDACTGIIAFDNTALFNMYGAKYESMNNAITQEMSKITAHARFHGNDSALKGDKALSGTNLSASALGSTSIKDFLVDLEGKFEAMYKRKAFLHWYTGEGMSNEEFELALENLKNLVSKC